MPREKREWHPRFIHYMDKIIHHPDYQGLPITKKADGTYNWIATAQSDIGKQRKQWCENKARELGIPIQPGVYADVMLEIHPTKWKVCQTCGREMSLYYHYPNAQFVKSLNKEFQCEFTTCNHISDIWDELIKSGIPKEKIACFLIAKGQLTLDNTASKEEIIDVLEYACRKGSKNCLGPGAMSNFPDRFDGFHTYNRCCRSKQDKGRSKENMKSYSKDRRAYEYWSDGNIHAANEFMGSHFFENISADHVGAISLGFVHDPRYLRPMETTDNAAKRDRLRYEDVELIIETESRTGIYPMSWYSSKIWEFIRNNYKNNRDKIGGIYRDGLKQNMMNFMFVLWTILENCPVNGETFLIQAFLEPKYHYFDFSYTFNANGEIINQTPRHFTARNSHELDRYCRIAIESVYDYMEKDNRNIEPILSELEVNMLQKICSQINDGTDITAVKRSVKTLMETIENDVINIISA